MIRTINFLSSRKSVLFPLLLIIIFFGIGSLLYFDTAFIPGDLGDARFNMYVLEHGYRWLSGLEESFWSPSFFYPESMVLAYSDAHIGTLPIYVILRRIGFMRESAFQGWIIVCSFLNFVFAFIVIRKILYLSDFRNIASALGAYLFTFGIPVIAQMNHAQLIPRFFVPVAFFALIRLLESRKTFYWYLLLISITGQLYVSIYTGYFTILCTFFTFIAWIGFNRKKYLSIKKIKYFLRNIRLKTVFVTFLIILLLLPLAIPYMRISHITGGRSWADVNSMLPRVQSYLTAPNSFLWKALLPDAKNLPMNHEHHLFIGLLPLLSILYFVFKHPEKSATTYRRVKILLTGVLITCVFTLYFGFSLYGLVFWIPGPNAIRAVARIILVILFPVAVVLACSTVFFLKWTKKRFGSSYPIFAGILISLVLIVDQSYSIASFPESESITKVEEVKKEFLQLKDKSVLWLPVNKEEPFYIPHLTAMLAAQELGVPTINGYSGHFPPDYPQSLISGEGDYCEALKKWLYIKTWNLDKKFTMDEIGQVGTADECNLKGAETLLPLQKAGFDN